MATITTAELRAIENVLEMDSGYVLDFTDRTFAGFFEEYSVDIDAAEFRTNGNSKAKRLRRFLQQGDEPLVGRALAGLWKRRHDWKPDGITKGDEEAFRSVVQRFGSLVETAPRPGAASQAGTLFNAVRPRPLAANSVTLSFRSNDPLERSNDPLQVMRDEFQSLGELPDRQRAGRVFEQLLFRLFEHYQLKPGSSIRLTGEQIDGSFELDHQVYILEAKWHAEPVATKDLYAFRAKVEGKASYTRGLFISVSGYSSEAPIAITKNKAPNFLMMDGDHLRHVLEGRQQLDDLLRQLVRRHGERGEPYVPLAAIEQ